MTTPLAAAQQASKPRLCILRVPSKKRPSPIPLTRALAIGARSCEKQYGASPKHAAHDRSKTCAAVAMRALCIETLHQLTAVIFSTSRISTLQEKPDASI